MSVVSVEQLVHLGATASESHLLQHLRLHVLALVVLLEVLRISVKACDFDRTFSGRVHNSSLNVDE